MSLSPASAAPAPRSLGPGRRLAATALLVLCLAATALAGCIGAPGATVEQGQSYREMGFDGTHWPDLHGAKVRVLAYSSFDASFKDHKEAFERLTNGSVELLVAEDSGKVLERAVQERGNPSFDVIYGVDNVLYAKAAAAGVFAPYEPVRSERIAPEYVFADGWHATPVTHGYIGLNVDPRAGLDIETLDDVREHAAEFVTEDPRTSTPGLGFLIATVATYGERSDERYDYLDYWNDLFARGALVTADWSQAYVGRFSGGYGQFEEGANTDKAIVTSYTTSPAYEMYYGYDTLNGVVTAPNSTFHQIQTMGIAKGTPNRAAAEAWIEYALTAEFQSYAAAGEAIYPVVANVSVTEVYQGRDPAPGTFEPAGFTHEQLGANVERWIREWTDAYEAARA